MLKHLKDAEEVFKCACSGLDHMIVVNIFDFTSEGEEKFKDEYDICFNFHLAPHGLFRRIKNAVKYVCGHRSNFGDFDEMLLDYAGVVRLKRLLDNYISYVDEAIEK